MAITTVTRSCLHCGTSFDALPANVKRGFSIYCSQRCSGLATAKRAPILARTCVRCETPFKTIKPYRRFCSKSCGAKNRGKNIDDGFWAYVQKSEACWLWTGSRNRDGYGNVSVKGIAGKSHRFSWILHNGAIPNGLLVCHKCDNPPCVNPDHLFLGTIQDNIADCVKKGRNASGDRSGARTKPHRWRKAWLAKRGEGGSQAKMTNDKVLEIRHKHAEGMNQHKIARIFNLHQTTIHQIVTRKTWKHI